METLYMITGNKPDHVICAEETLKKADNSDGLNVEISKYRRALNIIMEENKRMEQYERKISEEMEEIEYIIDSTNKTKPLWIDGYNPNNKSRGWIEPLNKDQHFLELYDFYNDINNEEINHNISTILSVPHEYRIVSDIKENSLNQSELMYMSNISIKTIGNKYYTGKNDEWGKIYISKDLFNHVDLSKNNYVNGVVKYTGDKIPWYMINIM